MFLHHFTLIMTNKPWPVFLFILNFISAIFLFFTPIWKCNAILVRNPALMQKIDWFHGNKMKILTIAKAWPRPAGCFLTVYYFRECSNYCENTHKILTAKKNITYFRFGLKLACRLRSLNMIAFMHLSHNLKCSYFHSRRFHQLTN